jgi:proteasome alpha subunit
VSLRRLANYSLSPALKTAFEQVYGAPYLARMLFAELGRCGAPNTFLRLDYDGAIFTNGGALGRATQEFGVISGTAASTTKMERFLREQKLPAPTLEKALEIALDAWTVGHLTQSGEPSEELPSAEAIAKAREEQLAASSIEAAILTDVGTQTVTWRSLRDTEIRPQFEKR